MTPDPDGETTREILLKEIRKRLKKQDKETREQFMRQQQMLEVNDDVWHLVRAYQAMRNHTGAALSEINHLLFSIQTRKRIFEDNLRTLSERLRK